MVAAPHYYFLCFSELLSTTPAATVATAVPVLCCAVQSQDVALADATLATFGECRVFCAICRSACVALLKECKRAQAVLARLGMQC